MDYKLVRDIDGTTSTTQVQRINDGAFIPFNEANIDYQEYLKWVAKGNKAMEADEA